MVQQNTSQHGGFFRRIEQAICQQFHQGTKTQALFVQPVNHRARGKRKLVVLLLLASIEKPSQ